MAYPTVMHGMEITETETGVYEVQSTSGKTYTVTYCGSGDGDPEYCALWECTCPAYRFGGGVCKHINAVSQWCDD